jgi:hypothetical protein
VAVYNRELPVTRDDLPHAVTSALPASSSPRVLFATDQFI